LRHSVVRNAWEVTRKADANCLKATSGFRLQAPGSRLQASGFRLRNPAAKSQLVKFVVVEEEKEFEIWVFVL